MQRICPPMSTGSSGSRRNGPNYNTREPPSFQVEKCYWQQFFSTGRPDEDVLPNFLYGDNPFRNLLALIDVENHRAEDNLRSDKFLEQVRIVNRLLELLGWQHARDESQLLKDKVKDNFAEKVVSDPLFKKQKRLNEIFDLEKAYNIHAEMTP